MIKKKELLEIFAQEIHSYKQRTSMGGKAEWNDLSYSAQLHYMCEAEMVLKVIQKAKARLENG